MTRSEPTDANVQRAISAEAREAHALTVITDYDELLKVVRADNAALREALEGACGLLASLINAGYQGRTIDWGEVSADWNALYAHFRDTAGQP